MDFDLSRGYISCQNHIYLTREGIEACHWKMTSCPGVIQKILQSMKVMEHSHVLNLFKLALRFLNVSNRVNVPKCSHESVQWKSLLQPGDKR
jgi:hypothetical protein